MSAPTDFIVQLLDQLQALDVSQAIALLKSAAATHPADARPLLLLAGLHAQAQDVDQSEAAYLMALQRNPDFAIARFQLGLLQFTCGRPNVALGTWTPLERFPEDHPLRLFAQAFDFLAQDRAGDALRSLSEGVARNTDNPPLNQDMVRLIERIEKAEMSSVPEGENLELRGPEDDSAPLASTQAHFLLSAYRRSK